jgi:hypothetical protein
MTIAAFAQIQKATMLLKGPRSPIAPFLGQGGKSYGKEKYSVIRFSYNFNIHCFDSK